MQSLKYNYCIAWNSAQTLKLAFIQNVCLRFRTISENVQQKFQAVGRMQQFFNVNHWSCDLVRNVCLQVICQTILFYSQVWILDIRLQVFLLSHLLGNVAWHGGECSFHSIQNGGRGVTLDRFLGAVSGAALEAAVVSSGSSLRVARLTLSPETSRAM